MRLASIPKWLTMTLHSLNFLEDYSQWSDKGVIHQQNMLVLCIAYKPKNVLQYMTPNHKCNVLLQLKRAQSPWWLPVNHKMLEKNELSQFALK